MDFKRRNILLVSLLTFVGIWHLISADRSFKKYYSDHSFDGRRCGPTETAFEVENVSDHLRCGWLCYFDNICGSFFYQPDLYKCIGCRVNFGVQACSHESYLGSKYFGSKLTHNKDCKDILQNQYSTQSGLHELSLWKSKTKLTVFCDMETDGGGWTVFQNRFDGSVDFNRSFSDYEYGFGNMSGEFWLGLKYIQELASECSTDIRLEMTRFNGEKYFQTYTDFKLLDGTDYKLSFEKGLVDGTPGVADEFNVHNGRPFSAFDRVLGDDGQYKDYCVNYYRGAWWYNNCGSVFLNGKYCTPKEARLYCLIFTGIGHIEPLQASRISIRRNGKE